MRTSASLTVYAVLSVVLLCLIVDFSEAQTDYCDPHLCRRKPHIACENEGEFGPKCEINAKIMPIGEELQNYIVDRHNSLRNAIAAGKVGEFKPAARMATIQWDKELQYLAMLNAIRCELKHDACRSTKRFPWAGQNLAYSGWPGTGEKESVQSIVDKHLTMWYNEFKNATPSMIDRYSSKNTFVGHFAQMIWESATHVGCGIVRQTKKRMAYQYMVCNYAFTPHYKMSVYETDSLAGAKCETGTNPSFTSLCTTSEEYDVVNIKIPKKP